MRDDVGPNLSEIMLSQRKHAEAHLAAKSAYPQIMGSHLLDFHLEVQQMSKTSTQSVSTDVAVSALQALPAVLLPL